MGRGNSCSTVLLKGRRSWAEGNRWNAGEVNLSALKGELSPHVLSTAATKGPASALLVETAANLPVLSWNFPFLPFVFVLLGLKRKKRKRVRDKESWAQCFQIEGHNGLEKGQNTGGKDGLSSNRGLHQQIYFSWLFHGRWTTFTQTQRAENISGYNVSRCTEKPHK